MIDEKFLRLAFHDLLNELNKIKMRIFLVPEKLEEKETAEIKEEVTVYCNAIQKIVRNFEEFLTEKELKYRNIEEDFKEITPFFPKLKTIEVILECQGLEVLADSRLKMIFFNLIDNSLKYAGKKLSEIKLYCKKKKDGFYILFEDNGEGIEKAEKELIFKEGYGQGSGKGLYLIRAICESYGWKIKETGIKLEGARFEIRV